MVGDGLGQRDRDPPRIVITPRVDASRPFPRRPEIPPIRLEVARDMVYPCTARHGTDLGFTVYVVSDCVAAADEATQAASLANLELTTAGCLAADDAMDWFRA